MPDPQRTPVSASLPDQEALGALLALQKPSGDFEGEMVWCTMILAQSVIVRFILDRPYSAEEQQRIIRHFEVTQTPEGAWGMHPESEGYVFFTTLGYVALRLLGLPADHPLTRQSIRWLKAQPAGVAGIPTWGKFWLAILGLYPYRGLNAIPPELFLLPEWFPLHPRRFYCHTRLIYLGLAFLSGKRFVTTKDPALLQQLGEELFEENQSLKNPAHLRHELAASDVHVPISPLLRWIYDGLARFERHPPARWREKALSLCLDRILYEQRSTRYQGISPVNGLLNTLAIFAEDPNHPELSDSLNGVEAWRWEDESEGLRYVGARSNTWDTAFVVQALIEITEPSAAVLETVRRAHAFFDHAQIQEELPDHQHYWRDAAIGGWCFSDGEHRWPVSDCTAEALSALIGVYQHPAYQGLTPLPESRLQQAVEFILSRQNRDGGFGTYERRRAGKLLEWINPSEMFGQCMTELSYLECTASSLSALVHYQTHAPDHRRTEINSACDRAARRLLKSQLADGSWPGFWGINYTYAAFHVVRALRRWGLTPTDPRLRKASSFLQSRQHQDGGWGEHFTSCLKGRYIDHPESQTVMTSWALLALMELEPADHPSIARGFLWLLSQKSPEGQWPRQAVNGVFFGAAMLDYRLYHTYFPVWAITRYNRLISGAPCCERATTVA